MPVLCEFNTQGVHPPSDPLPDFQTQLDFPVTFVARPRLVNGLRQLDIGNDADIRVKTILQYFTPQFADCHLTTWGDTTLFSSILDVLPLAPADLDFLAGEHMRNPLVDANDPSATRVEFDRPFLTPPKVVVFLNYIDMDKSKNWRLKTFAADLDVNGFTLNVETWGDSILNAAQVGWVAYPEDRVHIFSKSVNTQDVRAANQPQLETGGEITFAENNNDVEFWKDPAVFVALNYIDVDCKHNLRVNAKVENVSTNGLRWCMNSSADTILYAAGASIIAFNP